MKVSVWVGIVTTSDDETKSSGTIKFLIWTALTRGVYRERVLTLTVPVTAIDALRHFETG